MGLALALVVGGAAWHRSGSSGGYYDHEVYGMDRRVHRQYALASFLFAGCFAAAYALRLGTAAVAALALYVLIALFYGTSFLRGASDE